MLCKSVKFAILCKILYNKSIILNGIVKILTYITLEVIKMEERNKVTSIIKSNDPEKLVVFHAASLQNEIKTIRKVKFLKLKKI